jgi:nucleoside-diphosphate-sugar epimerase
MKTALVLGGSGFVGQYLARRLLKDGHTVVTVDTVKSPLVERNLIHCNMDARFFFKQGVYPREFDLVFHCAAVVGGRQSIDGSPLAVATNLSIDSEFFYWLSRLKKMPERVVFFSSSAVYPVEFQTAGRNLKLSEALVDTAGLVNGHISRLSMPDQTYGWAKLSGEILAQHAVKQGIPVVIYRPFSGYGPGQALDYPVPSILKRYLDGEEPIAIWGSGTQQRDFIFIDDVVDAVFETMHQLVPGETLNLGSGVGHTFCDLLLLADKEHGRLPTPSFDVSKPEGVHTRVADVHKLSRYFTPKVGLEEGIGRVADSLRSEK